MFKIGEIVRVKNGLEVGKQYGSLTLLNSMKKFCGEKIEIKNIKAGDYYCFNNEFNEGYYFSLEMLELIPKIKAKEYTLIITDKKVTILDKENKKKGIATCHEEDSFQFEVGAKLAWNRLHGIEETPKPVEHKLYDCNGVELKEGDKVKSICLADGTFYNNNIERNSDGILFNSGFGKTHRADRNSGRKDNSNTEYKWYVVKITK